MTRLPSGKRKSTIGDALSMVNPVIGGDRAESNWGQGTVGAVTPGTWAVSDFAVVAMNFTPVPRESYRLGVPKSGFYTELLNTDAEIYGGSGVGNLGGVTATDEPWHGRPASARIVLPPLATVWLRV